MRLILENTGIIKNADICLNGLTIIAGNNDSGKSTIGKIAYSLTKSFEDFELNYQREKNKAVRRYSFEVFRLLRRHFHIEKNKEFGRLLRSFVPFRKTDKNQLMEQLKEIRNFLEKNKENIEKEKLEGIKKKTEEIIQSLENSELEPQSSKIIKCIGDIFKSEFRGQLNNLASKNSRIRVMEGKNEIINLNINKEKISPKNSKKIDYIFPFDASVFIETPFILGYKEDLEDSDVYHIQDLLGKLESPEIYKNKSELKIDEIIKGSLFFDEEEKKFVFKKNILNKKSKIDILNSASGIRSFGILQLLEKAGEFDKSLLLIIDEPEVHLHPEWQVEYSKLLAKIVKKGINVLITSHSPYMIESLNKYSKEEGIYEKTNFYMSKKNKKGDAIIKDKTNSKEEIFEELSKPFERIVFNE